MCAASSARRLDCGVTTERRQDRIGRAESQVARTLYFGCEPGFAQAQAAGAVRCNFQAAVSPREGLNKLILSWSSNWSRHGGRAVEQSTFAELEHDSKKRRTRREVFLEKMDALLPWSRLEARIEPFYPKAGRGRRPYPLGVMLRVHCVQLFYNLSDPGMEALLYEVESVRRFVGLRLSGALPDETTILNFRHRLEKHALGEALFEEINAHLASLGHRLKTGTIVDASIITAPSSTKNRSGERDPQMHQTRKGKQWYFGMKAHIGVDAESGLAHSVETTPANTSDVVSAHALLHGGEERVWGDAGYQGVGKREENRDAAVDWEVAMKPGRRRLLDKEGPQEQAERRKASVRAKVEHPFLSVKRHFGYAKVRYRGLAKNTQRIAMLLGFSNLLIAGRYAVT